MTPKWRAFIAHYSSYNGQQYIQTFVLLTIFSHSTGETSIQWKAALLPVTDIHSMAIPDDQWRKKLIYSVPSDYSGIMILILRWWWRYWRRRKVVMIWKEAFILFNQYVMKPNQGDYWHSWPVAIRLHWPDCWHYYSDIILRRAEGDGRAWPIDGNYGIYPRWKEVFDYSVGRYLFRHSLSWYRSTTNDRWRYSIRWPAGDVTGPVIDLIPVIRYSGDIPFGIPIRIVFRRLQFSDEEKPDDWWPVLFQWPKPLFRPNCDGGRLFELFGKSAETSTMTIDLLLMTVTFVLTEAVGGRKTGWPVLLTYSSGRPVTIPEGDCDPRYQPILVTWLPASQSGIRTFLFIRLKPEGRHYWWWPDEHDYGRKASDGGLILIPFIASIDRWNVTFWWYCPEAWCPSHSHCVEKQRRDIRSSDYYCVTSDILPDHYIIPYYRPTHLQSIVGRIWEVTPVEAEEASRYIMMIPDVWYLKRKEEGILILPHWRGGKKSTVYPGGKYDCWSRHSDKTIHCLSAFHIPRKRPGEGGEEALHVSIHCSPTAHTSKYNYRWRWLPVMTPFYRRGGRSCYWWWNTDSLPEGIAVVRALLMLTGHDDWEWRPPIRYLLTTIPCRYRCSGRDDSPPIEILTTTFPSWPIFNCACRIGDLLTGRAYPFGRGDIGSNDIRPTVTWLAMREDRWYSAFYGDLQSIRCRLSIIPYSISGIDHSSGDLTWPIRYSMVWRGVFIRVVPDSDLANSVVVFGYLTSY